MRGAAEERAPKAGRRLGTDSESGGAAEERARICPKTTKNGCLLRRPIRKDGGAVDRGGLENR